MARVSVRYFCLLQEEMERLQTLEAFQTWLQGKIDNVGEEKALLIIAVDQSHTFISACCVG